MKNYQIAIRNYISEPPAIMDKMLLEGSGVEAIIQKDDCGGMRPYLQVMTGVQLLVAQEDVERAMEILKETEIG